MRKRLQQKSLRSVGKCRVIETDVADGDSVRKMVQETLDTFGRIDVLVNNAGIFSYTRIDACTEAEWDRMMAVNLKGSIPLFTGSHGNDESTTFRADHQPRFGWQAQVGGLVASAPYSASKAGVMCLTKSLARVLGRVQYYGELHRTGGRGNRDGKKSSRHDRSDSIRARRGCFGDCECYPLSRLRRRTAT